MHILIRGSRAQHVRLVTGLILFVFALTHFLNHAVGLISVEAMNDVREWRTWITRSILGTTILAFCLLAHAGLALAKLANRNTLRMTGWEVTQLILGLAIPFTLLPHIVSTSVAHRLFDVDDNYLYELANLWPGLAVEQSILLLLVWIHGCVGLHFWLRLSRHYDRAFLLLFSIAVLVPAAGLAGFMAGGRALQVELANPDFVEELLDITNWPDAAERAQILFWSKVSRFGFYGALLTALAVIGFRMIRAHLAKRIEVDYRTERRVRAAPGPTLLEISRMNGIPHTSVCGGRARCSTCRVEVIKGGDLLSPPLGAEAQTLKSIGANENVRLACQARPLNHLSVLRLVIAEEAPKPREHTPDSDSQGVERALAVLFLDVRNFTGISEDKLPYDVVFILNRLFSAAGAAITANGGWIDKYLGDGMMAVFGRETGAEAGCRDAIAAARAIDLVLDDINDDLASEVDQPLRVGIGIHVGPLVLGKIGHPETASMTVIGRTVNAASRLESLSKDLGCQLVVSSEAAEYAGLDLQRLELQSVMVRGLTRPLDVASFKRARDVAELAPIGAN